MEKLPFLISIPHAGTQIPPELKSSVCITDRDLFNDSDSFTKEIYSVDDIVEEQVTTHIARAFVDNSRDIVLLPPKYKDGLIKSATCYNQPIYKDGCHPNEEMMAQLIEKYYNDYHRRIQTALKSPKVKLMIDCHSMADIAPDIAPDTGQKRPLINLGDAEGRACDFETTKILKQCVERVFGFSSEEVTINNPFKGGFITRKYGKNPKPVIQFEMNRKLYLADEYFSFDSLKMKNDRLSDLNHLFRKVLTLFDKKMQLS